MPEWPRRLGKLTCIFLVPALVLALTISVVAAQQPLPVPIQGKAVIGQVIVAPESPKPDAAHAEGISLPRNPESKRLIQAAQDYIKKKEWRIASECLQNLLENPDDSFIEVRRKDAQGVEQDARVSVRDEANRIIGGLPADGLESYQLQYGQAAANRLREATERADPAMLAEVSQRYFHTKAGREATNLLGTYQLDRGQFLMASLCFERLLARPDADTLSPKILFKAALAYRRSGDVPAAERLLTKITERAGRGEVAFNRLRLTVDQMRAELNRDFGADSIVSLFDWPIFRGNAHRNARGSGGTAYLIPDWAASMYKKEDKESLSDPGDLPAITWIDQHLEIALQSLKDRPILPAFFPVTAGNRLLVRTYDGVSAYALTSGQYGPAGHEVWKKRGAILWRSGAERSLFASIRQDDRGQRMTIHSWYNQDYRGNAGGPMGVFFENSVLGTISHDGKRAYFIDDLGVPPHPYRLMTANMGGSINFGPFNDEVQNNRLQSVDLASGKLCWSRLGGKGPAPSGAAPSSATEMLDSFFLSPPLPLGGKLYLLTEKNGELRLVCLDPEKLHPSPLVPNEQVPELVWIQSLGTATSKLPTDSTRRTQGAHLAYGDGILVCPTNVGAVIGVDLLTHSLAWAYSYPRVAVPMPNEEMMWRRGFANRYGNNTATEHWRASAPVIAKDRVVLTSPDSTHVDCLNLRDGRKLWSVARDEADLYLAGVFEGRAIIVARNAVKALDLQTGKLAWNQPRTGMPAGEGVAGNGVYYLPLASSVDVSPAEQGPEICAVDIKTGKILGHSKARDEAPGNLLFVNGDLISQSASRIASFPLLKVKQDEINRALAKNGDDATGLTERGEMYLYDGAIPEAVADLRKALANKPSPEVRRKAQRKLFAALTKWMQSDFNTAEKYLGEFDELCRIDDDDSDGALRRRAIYLELLGRGRERQGRLFDAFSAYEQYGKLGGNRELVESIEEPNTKARPDIWSRGRIQALIAGAKPADKKNIEGEIIRRWEQLRTSSNLNDLRAFVGLYGSISAAGMSARLELASRLIGTGDPDELTEAERVLAPLCYGSVQRGDDPAIIARALDLMITLCVRRGQFENAVGFYRRLGTEFGNVNVRDGRTGRELWNDLPTDKRFIPYLEVPGTIWPSSFSLREDARNVPVRRESSITIDPLGELQPFFERHRIVLDIGDDSTSAKLRVIDRTTGEERWWAHNLPAPRGMANHYQVWAQGGPSFDGRQPIAYARGDDLILHINNMIIAFDLVERKELWRKNLFGRDALLNSQDNNFKVDDKNNTVVVVNDKEIPLGKIAAVESPYVALQTREGLEVLDPTMPGPNTMWAKDDVGLKATVFGDHRRIYVLDTAPDNAAPRLRVLNAANGVAEALPDNSEALARMLTDAYAKKIRILRGQLLIADHGGRTIRLIDPATGKDHWSREFSNGTVVVQCDDRLLVGAIEPAGLFTLLNALTGEVRFTSRLLPEHVEKLQSATLVSDHEQYYLALMRPPDQGVQFDSAMRNTVRVVQTNGYVYAYSKKSGKLDWTSAIPISHQFLVMEQMTELPVLLFTTQFTRSNANVPEQQGVKVTGIVKSNGKLLVDKTYHSNTQFHALLPRPSDGKIELHRQDLKLIFEPKK